jgi:hypothetical protein
MHNRIMLAQAAKLNGDAPGTYRSMVSQHLQHVGVRQGRDRWVNFPETTLLRIMTELNTGNLNLIRSAERAVQLLPYLGDIAADRLGAGGREVFACHLWGQVDGEERVAGYICDGSDLLLRCIQSAVEKRWPNMRVLNLTRLVLETQVGWALATQGEYGKALVMTTLNDNATPDERQAASAFVAEMERRLTGERRGETVANDYWKRWEEPPPAAAA